MAVPESESEPLSYDPSDYSSKKLSAEIIHFLLSRKKDMSLEEPYKNAAWSYEEHPDGSKKKRNWLVYSQKRKCLFCLPCLIFGAPTRRTSMGATHFSVNGYSDWVNVSRDVKAHGKSVYHAESNMALIRFNSRKQRIDKELAEQQNYWVNHNRAVLSVVIDCVRFLTENMLAFRNSKDGRGKLYNLFRLLAKYNSDACAYLERVQKSRKDKKRMRVNFLAYTSVSNLVRIMKDMVVEIICQRIRESGERYSIIMDSTQDASRLESTVLLVRYIEGIVYQDDLSIIPHPIPVERLLNVFTSKETSGLELYKRTKDILKANDLNISNIVGQSYDGAGSMRGCTKGLKTLIQIDCPMALYIWCSSHRFSLVIEKTVEHCGSLKDFFGILDELYTFMHWSHRRHGTFVQVLKESEEKNEGLKSKNFSKQRLKRIRTTRWGSKHEASKTLKSCFGEILECLEIIGNDKNTVAEFKTMAEGLKTKMFTFRFVMVLEICVTIFDVLSPTTVMLQGTMNDFGSASSIIDHTIRALKALRNDESWETLCKNAFKLCSEYGIKRKEKRVSRKKRFFDEYGLEYYEQPDDITQLKVDAVYYTMIDSLLMQISERFQHDVLEIMKEMRMFNHENLLKEKSTTRAENLCEHYGLDVETIENELKDFKQVYKLMEKDIDVSDIMKSSDQPNVTNENQSEQTQVNSSINPNESDFQESEEDDDEKDDFRAKGMHSFILTTGYIKPFRLLLQLSQFKNLFVLYKILLILAVTSCSAERALSKQKIIKNPIRSSMLDDWMSGMMILASEVDILNSISNEDIINRFAQSSKVYSELLIK